MNIWPFAKKQNRYAPSKAQLKARNFNSGEQSRLYDGWTTSTSSVDAFLARQLTVMRARSREQSRNDPLYKRAISVMQKNIVGASGIQVHPKVRATKGREGTDRPANQAIKKNWLEWSDQADVNGRLTFVEMMGLGIRSAAVDGEFILRRHFSGNWGLQFQVIDPELLDATRCQTESNGNITRLGVEYSDGRAVAYWFREVDEYGNYYSGKQTRVPAHLIIHGFLTDWVDQSRGVPWGYSTALKQKGLDSMDHSALTAARAGASKMGFITGGNDDDDELDGEQAVMDFSPGTIDKLGEDEEFQGFDPSYPNEVYAPFSQKFQRDIACGWDLTYATLTGDMSDVNYSSIRFGGQSEREGHIDRQNWLIRICVRPIYEEVIRNSILRERIRIGNTPLSRPVTEYYPAHYQGQRWASTDPMKESRSNASDIENNINSPQRIIAARGDDPDEILEELLEWKTATAGLQNEIS